MNKYSTFVALCIITVLLIFSNYNKLNTINDSLLLEIKKETNKSDEIISELNDIKTNLQNIENELDVFKTIYDVNDFSNLPDISERLESKDYNFIKIETSYGGVYRISVDDIDEIEFLINFTNNMVTISNKVSDCTYIIHETFDKNDNGDRILELLLIGNYDINKPLDESNIINRAPIKSIKIN